ncbi:ABC transporter ATP-binding protein [Metabacillus fastidiosus]|uniref:ABC transporter ATP-binding protein n=2 Tax=Metabacillus fastidiosus TaxID=1458 RepID=UPI003D2B8DD1
MMGNEEKKSRKEIWKAYFRLVFKAKVPWVWLIIITVALIAQSTLSLLFPQYTQKIMAGDISKTVVYTAVGIIVLQTVMSGFVRYINKIVIYKIDVSYRSLIWKRLMRSPLHLYDEVKPSEMVSRTAADTAQISQVLGGLFPSAISTVYATAGTIAILFSYDWKLGLSVLIFAPIYVITMIVYGKWNYRANKVAYDRLAKLTQFLSELLVSIPLIKSFVTEKKEEKRGEANIQSYYKASMRRAIINWIETPLVVFMNLIQTILVIVLGIYFVSKGDITIDVWIAFNMYVAFLWVELESYNRMYIQLKVSQGATSRIAALVDSPLEDYEQGKPLTKIDTDLIFEEVSFSYGDNHVLKDITVTIPHGKVTAIVGASGGGKSTIISLIQRFYSPDRGRILLGDTPIEQYNLEDWRNAYSYVAQDSLLLSGTIRENIIYGVKRDVSEKEIIEAAEAASALQFIEELPDGFDTEVGESGAKLSGGQRQRIAIARALLRDSQFLLLDEPTSSLDSRSEKAVQDAINRLIDGRTAVIIAHDLSTIQDADQIILIDEGKIDGVGTHEELLQTNTLYKLFVKLHLESSAS